METREKQRLLTLIIIVSLLAIASIIGFIIVPEIKEQNNSENVAENQDNKSNNTGENVSKKMIQVIIKMKKMNLTQIQVIMKIQIIMILLEKKSKTVKQHHQIIHKPRKKRLLNLQKINGEKMMKLYHLILSKKMENYIMLL